MTSANKENGGSFEDGGDRVNNGTGDTEGDNSEDDDNLSKSHGEIGLADVEEDSDDDDLYERSSRERSVGSRNAETGALSTIHCLLS